MGGQTFSSEQATDRRPRNALVALGSSLYWASCLLSLSDLSGFSSLRPPSVVLLTQSSCAISVFAVAFFARRNLPSTVLARLNHTASFLCAMGCLLFLVYYAAEGLRIPELIIASETILGFGMGILMQLWSLRFANTGIRDSIGTTCSSVLLSVAFYFVGVSLPIPMASILYCIYPLVSCLCSSLVRDDGSDKVMSSVDTITVRLPWIGFWTTRFLYGLVIGVVVGLAHSQTVEPVLSDSVKTICGVVGVLALLLIIVGFLSKFRASIEAYWLPGIPFVVLMVFSILFLGLGFTHLVYICIVFSWVCFMVLSSMQIANFRMLFGMKATDIAFREKTVVFLAWTFGSFIGVYLGTLLGDRLDAADVIALSFSGILLFATVIALSRYSSQLKELDYFKRAPQNLSALVASRCHRLAITYSLTPREEEIMTLLAQGRSGRYITGELVISEGTFKTHYYHIYQKLGIHKNQELIDMVNATDSEG
jgi:DNA-binding CsgD family transcriptional regulator